jgi:hypothetical protein
LRLDRRQFFPYHFHHAALEDQQIVIRDQFAGSRPHVEAEFHWRGHEVTRVEGFSDAVFAFAVTLLVVSLEVPRTFSELFDAMRGFIAFALCFAFLVWVWHAHYLFFRRYGLQDRHTILLNSLLLFTVLFYVYPLKFLATIMVNQVIYHQSTVSLPEGRVEPVLSPGQEPVLMCIYSIGFVAVFVVLALMYLHAHRRRHDLALDPLETLETQSRLADYGSVALVGVVSLVLLAAGGEHRVAFAGYSYFLIGVVRTVNGIIAGKRKRALLADRSHKSPPNH